MKNASYYLVRECCIQHPPPTRMFPLISEIPRVRSIHPPHPSLVEPRLLHICLCIVDCAIGRRGIEDDVVWAAAEDGAIELRELPEPDVAVATQGVVEEGPVGELGEERS